MDRLTIYACMYVDYSRLFFRVYVLLFSVDLYSVNPVIIIIYKILHNLSEIINGSKKGNKLIHSNIKNQALQILNLKHTMHSYYY